MIVLVNAINKLLMIKFFVKKIKIHFNNMTLKPIENKKFTCLNLIKKIVKFD